jgi:hypothetical protein
MAGFLFEDAATKGLTKDNRLLPQPFPVQRLDARAGHISGRKKISGHEILHKILVKVLRYGGVCQQGMHEKRSFLLDCRIAMDTWRCTRVNDAA